MGLFLDLQILSLTLFPNPVPIPNPCLKICSKVLEILGEIAKSEGNGVLEGLFFFLLLFFIKILLTPKGSIFH